MTGFSGMKWRRMEKWNGRGGEIKRTYNIVLLILNYENGA
jgi:hypothetical protein